MKKFITFFLLSSLIFVACNNFIVIQRDPAILDSTIELSGEVSGDIYPEMRTMRMHATGQANNFLLLEIFGMETYAGTESVVVTDSLHGTDIYLSVVENDTSGNERVYRNLRFWIGPFDKEEYYTLHLSESDNALRPDTLSLSFSYNQNLDENISADDCYFFLSENPFDSIVTRAVNQSDIPDFFTNPYYEDNWRTLHFFDTDSGLLIQVISSSTCALHHEASCQVVGDTLFLLGEIDPPGMDCCDEFYFYDYLIKDYSDQIFYYQFILNNSGWAAYEGIYGDE